MTERELARIRRAYEARDAAESSPYRWDNPGYVIFIQAVERAVLRALGDAGVTLSQARVLDVGCGGGYFLNRFREYGAGECHGIDLMERRVAAARERYPTLLLRAGSATELPYGDGAFDLVTQFTCLSSIVDDDVRLAAAREIRRVASEGCILSFDIRPRRMLRTNVRGSTPTVGLGQDELQRLFGEPLLLRPAGMDFDLAQRVGSHPFLASMAAAVPVLRRHLLGMWNVAHSER